MVDEDRSVGATSREFELTASTLRLWVEHARPIAITATARSSASYGFSVRDHVHVQQRPIH